MSELDLLDREVVKERDIQRLRNMERYCYTTECLRNFILQYFGEKPESPCEDCGNCLREFETIDMTDAAKKIINCVFEAKGRYGKTIIIDVVVGAKTTRLEEIGAVDYKSYGVLAATNKNLIKRLIEQLVLEGYLEIGDYQVLKLGDISGLKNLGKKVLVKINNEDKLLKKNKKLHKKLNGTEALTSAGFKLFDKLRTLRLEIAREENVPPYIIFSDKTLIDMAAKVPESKVEMLNVSGVGEHKFVKYGERFLVLIEECVADYPEMVQNKKETSHNDESNCFTKIREKHAGAYMSWTEEEDRKLSNEYKSGQFSIHDLSEIHGRTRGAIRSRLKKLKLIEV